MKYLLYSFLFFSVLNCYSQNNDVFGVWKNINKNNYISMIEFKNDNTAVLHDENGLNSTLFTFKMNKNKTPHWIDFQINKNGVISEMYGLIEFIDTKNIKFEITINHKDKHPINFSNDYSDDTKMLFYLTKSN